MKLSDLRLRRLEAIAPPNANNNAKEEPSILEGVPSIPPPEAAPAKSSGILPNLFKRRSTISTITRSESHHHHPHLPHLPHHRERSESKPVTPTLLSPVTSPVRHSKSEEEPVKSPRASLSTSTENLLEKMPEQNVGAYRSSLSIPIVKSNSEPSKQGIRII
jgi:hypothetical protein